MFNYERERQYSESLEHRSVFSRLRAGTDALVSRARARAELIFGREVEVIYGLPVRQDNLTKYFSPQFFGYLPNPLGLDLYQIAQDLVEEKKGTVHDREKDSQHIADNRAVIRTDHSSEFAMPGFFNYDERAVSIAGSEALVSTILGGGDALDTFTHLRYDNTEVPLFREDGSSFLLHEIFDQLPNPLLAGTSVVFSNRSYILEATVLPIPDQFVIPQVCLIGPSENSNLNKIIEEVAPKGGRIVINFKEGHEGIANGFMQAGFRYDVYEIEDVDKRKVKRKNGRLVRMRGLPPIEPGKVQGVLNPVEGKVEASVREDTIAIKKGLTIRRQIPNADAVFGIDVIESGYSATNASLVPIKFRQPGSVQEHIDGNRILGWYHSNHDRYLDYVRQNTIMPVQPVAIRVRRNSS